MDSQTAVSTLLQIDPQFETLCKTLFGDAVDPAEAWEYLYAPDGVSKMMPGPSDLAVPSGLARQGRTVLRAALPKKPPMPKPAMAARAQAPAAMGVRKDAVIEDEAFAQDLVWSGEFSKFSDDKRYAFGWASITQVGGKPVVDLQGDVITPEDLEDAAYRFVQKSRVGGTQHERDEWDRPVQAGVMIESKVWTDEKYEAFAKSIDLDPALFADAPRGWEVGFYYEDLDTWSDIKKGLKTGFSIHGRGKRMPLEV